MNAKAIDGMSNEEYHARPEVSNSMMGDFIEAPELFHGRYIAKTIPRKSPTPAMVFGTLVHDAVLLGIDNMAVECPRDVLDKAGKRNGKKFQEWAAEHPGKSLLLRDGDYGYTNLRNTVDAILSHPVASRLLDKSNAVMEQAIFWQDEETGLQCRVKLDVRQLGIPLIGDIKTCNDVSRKAIARKMDDFGYTRQCAFYREGSKAYTGKHHDFVFIFAEPAPPHRVRCYELDPREDRAAHKGYEDMRWALGRIAECNDTGIWREAGWDEILTIDLPNWAYNNEWELA